MTRLFLHGRTETVRPVTMESAAFVKAMVDPNVAVRHATTRLVNSAHRVEAATHARGSSPWARTGAVHRTRSASACCMSPPTSTRTATARP